MQLKDKIYKNMLKFPVPPLVTHSHPLPLANQISELIFQQNMFYRY